MKNTICLPAPTRRLLVCLCFALIPKASAMENWESALAQMPLRTRVSELNRSNVVPVMLQAFRANGAIKAMVFMPGATDEFYFFRRARAVLTNHPPTLLDAVIALTNQTYIQATFRPPLLLLHTSEDPLEPLIRIEDEPTAERIRKRKFERQVLCQDKDWDYVQPMLSFHLDTKILPGLRSHESHHFFRHSLAANQLTGWEAIEAISLAGKTTVTIKKKKLLFDGDTRVRGHPKLDNISTFQR